MTSAESDPGAASARWLADQGKALEQALAELVEINSFTENVEGGRRVGALLEELFAIDGLRSRRIPSATYADHLVIRSTADERGADPAGADPAGTPPPIALVGHLDTVFPPGTFEGYRRDGELARGPGVLDMKGGLVVVAWALRALAEVGALPPLRLAIVADEEVGSPEGARVIEQAIAGATGALVFEAGRAGDAIITRRKGTGALHVIARGVAAHAGNAHKEGKNALWALARLIDRAQGLTDYARGVTVNVGKVTGGVGKNTVPDLAEAWVDMRFESRSDAEALLAALHAAAKAASDEVPGTSIEIEGGIARLPLERTDASVALLERYGASARLAGLGAGEASLIGGGSDASTAHAMGIAAIDGLGPRGKGFHTKDEQIEVRSLLMKAEALARYLASLHLASLASLRAR